MKRGVDLILVGDSLAMVALGYETTLPLTLEEMLHHAKAVRRGVKQALLVVDLPFLTYQESPQQALHSAGRVLKEAGGRRRQVRRGTSRNERNCREISTSGDSRDGPCGTHSPICASAWLPQTRND